MKKKYVIDVYKKLDCEDIENEMEYFVSTEETYAISEKQAINNIRFRLIGNNSQYKPLEISGHWETKMIYKIRK